MYTVAISTCRAMAQYCAVAHERVKILLLLVVVILIGRCWSYDCAGGEVGQTEGREGGTE